MVVMLKNLVDKNFFCIKQAGDELSLDQSNLDQIKFKQVELSPTWKGLAQHGLCLPQI